jgi:hypothetical protein
MPGHFFGRWLVHGYGSAFYIWPTWCETQKQTPQTHPRRGTLGRTALPKSAQHNLPSGSTAVNGPKIGTLLGVAFPNGGIRRGATVKQYVWTGLYEIALFETDDKKLPCCLDAARAAIDRRLTEIQVERVSSPEELRAITNALRILQVLRTGLEKHIS